VKCKSDSQTEEINLPHCVIPLALT